jgi:4-amino-4-deoxy-L-arabinose transferase-like glycosyltransferase
VTRRPWLELGALAGLLAAAAALFAQALELGPNYDEGVYLASADALGRGERLGEDVFASQPPGFYLLLRLATALPGESVDATRAVFVAVALLGVVAAWAVGWQLAGPVGGLAAAGTLLAAPAYAAESARVAADTPSVALALVALALLAAALRRVSPRLALAAGPVFALAVSVKLFVLVLGVAAVALLALERAPRRLVAAFVAGGLAVTAALLLAYVDRLGVLYEGVVGFHEEARGLSVSTDSNADRLGLAFVRKGQVFTWLVVAGLCVWLVRRARPRRLLALWLGAVAAGAFLLWHQPLIDHHFVLVAAALAVPAGASLDLRLGSRRSAAFAALLALVLLAGYAQQWRRVNRLEGPDLARAQAAEAVAAETRPGELIVTDLPIVAVLAGRGVPGKLVDTSIVRFRSGSLDADCVLGEANAAGARLVVAGRAFRIVPGVLKFLTAEFPQRREVAGITLLERSPAAAARAARRAGPGSCS